MSPASRYLQAKQRVAETALRCGRRAEEIEVVVITKGRSSFAIKEVYDAGCRLVGENRLQEAVEKISELPSDMVWHFVGTLQKNKIAQTLDHFAMIHSIDTPELASAVACKAEKKGKRCQVLLQVNTSGEATKHGLTSDAWRSHIETLLSLPGLQVMGLMTMAPPTEEEWILRKCFRKLRSFREELRDQWGEALSLPHLSMGMSGDYPIAIEEGATLVRLGTAIFGALS